MKKIIIKSKNSYYAVHILAMMSWISCCSKSRPKYNDPSRTSNVSQSKFSKCTGTADAGSQQTELSIFYKLSITSGLTSVFLCLHSLDDSLHKSSSTYAGEIVGVQDVFSKLWLFPSEICCSTSISLYFHQRTFYTGSHPHASTCLWCHCIFYEPMHDMSYVGWSLSQLLCCKLHSICGSFPAELHVVNHDNRF